MDEHDEIAMAVDVMRTMRETLGPKRFRRAVAEAEATDKPPPKRRRRRARVSPTEAARRAADRAGGEPDDLARQRARRSLRRQGLR